MRRVEQLVLPGLPMTIPPTVADLLFVASALRAAGDGTPVAVLVDVDRRTARRVVAALVAGELIWRGVAYPLERAEDLRLERRLERRGRPLVVRRGPPPETCRCPFCPPRRRDCDVCDGAGVVPVDSRPPVAVVDLEDNVDEYDNAPHTGDRLAADVLSFRVVPGGWS